MRVHSRRHQRPHLFLPSLLREMSRNSSYPEPVLFCAVVSVPNRLSPLVWCEWIYIVFFDVIVDIYVFLLELCLSSVTGRTLSLPSVFGIIVTKVSFGTPGKSEDVPFELVGYVPANESKIGNSAWVSPNWVSISHIVFMWLRYSCRKY